MDLTELGAIVAIPDLAKRMTSVDRRVVDAMLPYRDALGPAPFDVLTARGKRLRAALTITVAQLGGLSDMRVIDAAAAIELVQVGSLVHDDVIDGAQVRRGQPTIHSVLGPGRALVAGDLALAVAGAMVARLGRPASLLLADGMTEMATGQLLEMQDAFDTQRTVERHVAAVRGKTGALFACACRLGAWCAAMPDSAQDAATEFGGSFGVVYQLVDDLLDVAGSTDGLGKGVGVDAATGVYTTPILLALRGPRGRRIGRLLRGRASADVAEALRLVRGTPAMQQSVEALPEWIARAEDAATRLGSTAIAAGLRRLPMAYAERALAGASVDVTPLRSPATAPRPAPADPDLPPRQRRRPLRGDRRPPQS
jgi:geranylgeranyl pyrophosphate synthase